jgi:hypothetical protein
MENILNEKFYKVIADLEKEYSSIELDYFI